MNSGMICNEQCEGCVHRLLSLRRYGHLLCKQTPPEAGTEVVMREAVRLEDDGGEMPFAWHLAMLNAVHQLAHALSIEKQLRTDASQLVAG